MSLGTVVSYFFGVWASVYLSDVALRTHPYTRQWYTELTARMGLSIDILQARFFTQRLNRFFHYICRFSCIPWKLWFSCGVVFSAIFMVFSVFLLSLLAYNTLMRKPIEAQILTPVMPGVNLPMSHLGFYMLTLLLCAFLHEAGHALAAVNERVRLHGFGLFLFGFYPGAYVDLNSGDLQNLSPLSQLRVYCAGVWHNAVIAVVSLLIFCMLPVLLSPGYNLGTGVGVTYLRENSVVTGHRGLTLGDAITRVNSCPVQKQSDWYRCLEQAYSHPSGYCVTGAYLTMLDANVQTSKIHAPRRSLAAVAVPNRIPELDHNKNAEDAGQFVPVSISSSEEDCCAAHLASTHLCFKYSVQSKHGSSTLKYACLPARAVTERSSCNYTSDCNYQMALRPGNHAVNAAADSLSHLNGLSSRMMHCVVPSPPDNSTRLVRLVHNRQEAPAILFLGPMDDLISSVEVSDYVPRWPHLLSPHLPTFVGLLCTYLFSLSGALVILNVVPCYALDGQWILQAFIDMFLSRILPSRRKRTTIFLLVVSIGSVLLFTNLCLALLYLISEANLTYSSSSVVDTVLPTVRKTGTV